MDSKSERWSHFAWNDILTSFTRSALWRFWGCLCSWGVVCRPSYPGVQYHIRQPFAFTIRDLLRTHSLPTFTNPTTPANSLHTNCGNSGTHGSMEKYAGQTRAMAGGTVWTECAEGEAWLHGCLEEFVGRKRATPCSLTITARHSSVSLFSSLRFFGKRDLDAIFFIISGLETYHTLLSLALYYLLHFPSHFSFPYALNILLQVTTSTWTVRVRKM